MEHFAPSYVSLAQNNFQIEGIMEGAPPGSEASAAALFLIAENVQGSTDIRDFITQQCLIEIQMFATK